MFKIKNLLSTSANPESIGFKFRNRRFIVFETLIDRNFTKNKKLKILDVGGAAYFWSDKDFLEKYDVEITMLNLVAVESGHPKLKSVKGDATDLSEYQNDSFDLVFSNSVIEHLYTWENQVKMAEECVRVGKKHFIQTPNRHFFVEAHYTLPFAQYLPDKLLFDILTKTKLSQTRKWDPGDAKQYIEEIRLLTGKEVKTLFPSSKIYKEKFIGMTKSFVAHNL